MDRSRRRKHSKKHWKRIWNKYSRNDFFGGIYSSGGRSTLKLNLGTELLGLKLGDLNDARIGIGLEEHKLQQFHAGGATGPTSPGFQQILNFGMDLHGQK